MLQHDETFHAPHRVYLTKANTYIYCRITPHYIEQRKRGEKGECNT